MTCTACGDHSGKACGCKNCTKAVLEITNPEKIILLRKVVIPASMGDDTTVPAALGKYCNVILYYEANRHVYLYSSDGIPTLLESEVPQEVIDRIEDLENEDIRLQTEIDTEEQTRASADEQLGADIAAEATARTQAIADEAQARTTAIENEAQARTTAIENEAQARTNAIAAETTARENADTNLQNAISDEVTARQTADTNLQTAITTAVQNEAQARTTAIAAEATIRQTTDTGLQTQIDAIVASSDVKDIVGTYAALQQYDTSTLGDRDIIKVLQDETHQDETTYYRWSTSTRTFTLIGEEGPYYTKAATDTLLNAKADKSTTYTKTETDTLLGAKQDTLTAGEAIDITNNVIKATNTGKERVLTADDYNDKWSPVSTENDCVALWKLPRGTYLAPIGIKRKAAAAYMDSGNQASSYLVTGDENYTIVVEYGWSTVGGTPAGGKIYQLTDNAGAIRNGYPQNILTSGLVKNTLTETYTGYILAAPQGKVLADSIGDLSTLTTTAKTSAVAAINELAATPGAATVSSQDWSDLWQ